jgi:transcriptional regulator with XRE-family HTH domain
MKRGAVLLRGLVSPQVNQETVAKELECSQQAVSAWVNGQAKPSLERMLKLEHLFGIPVASWAEEVAEESAAEAAKTTPSDPEAA